MPERLRKSYDVIIVGAGPAGIFCAFKLVEGMTAFFEKREPVFKGE